MIHELFFIANLVKESYRNDLRTEIQREKIPFLKFHIVINKDDIIYLKPIIQKKKNKRNRKSL